VVWQGKRDEKSLHEHVAECSEPGGGDGAWDVDGRGEEAADRGGEEDEQAPGFKRKSGEIGVEAGEIGERRPGGLVRLAA
jgi:hypothetical protein